MSLARRRKRGIIWGVVLYLPCVGNTVVEERYVPLVGGREKGLIAIGAVGERERERRLVYGQRHGRTSRMRRKRYETW